METLQPVNSPDDSIIHLDEADKDEAWTFFADKMSELVKLRDALESQQSPIIRQAIVEQIKWQMPELETNNIGYIREAVGRELGNLVAIIPGVSADSAQDNEKASAYLTQKVDTWLGIVNRKVKWHNQFTQDQKKAISNRRYNSFSNAANGLSILKIIDPEAAQPLQSVYSQTVNNFKLE